MLLEVIRKWLNQRLQLTFSVSPAYFFEATKDGTLMARILNHYGVITDDEQNQVVESKDPQVMAENYSKHIRQWLQRINFDLSPEEIEEITFGDNSASTSIFYELYMKLDNRRGTIYRPKRHGFKIEKVPKKLPTDLFEVNPLCEPLMKQWDVINWERDHMAALMLKYAQSRSQYHTYVESKKVEELEQAEKKELVEGSLRLLERAKRDYTYEELVLQQREALAMKPFVPSKNEAKKIMRQIKERGKQRAEKNAFRLELQHEFMQEVWKKIDEMEEDNLDKLVCNMLLKQSEHEKEIAEKLLEIRREKEFMIENRKKQDEIDRKKRDEEFVRRLFEEALEERMKFHEERMALIAEHQKLYAEHLRLKALKHETICKQALDDIVDLALKSDEYKKLYGVEPNKYTLKEWATLFINEQPIFDMIAPAEIKKPPPEDVTEELEEIYRKEIKRQDVLDSQDFDDYVHFRNVWTIEEGFEESMPLMELGMNCLGFAVHKLLLKKYPLQIPVKPELSQEIEVAVCANDVTDPKRIDCLKRLLNIRNIKVIQMEDATDFCIKAYDAELKTEFDDPFPEDEMNLKQLTPKGKEEGKGKGGKKEKKDKKGKKEKGSKKDKKKDKKDASKTKVPVLTFEDKQAQTPRLFPWEKIIFSNKAKLGRIAKQVLAQENVLTDQLLVDMFVEYLLSMPDIKGWLLLNYPNNYEQAALLEQALSGKPVPKQYYDKILNKQSLESVGVDTHDDEKREEEEGEVEEGEDEEWPEMTGYSNETLEQDDETASSSKSTLSGPLTKTSSVKYSVFSTVTVLTDYDLTPQDKVTQLLPDLKDIVYSSEEEGEEETVQSEKKICTCVCNPVKPKPQPRASDARRQTQDTLGAINEEEIGDASETAVGDSEIKVNSQEQGLPQSLREECLCYVLNVQPEDLLATKEEITQTDILGLEQDLGDEPLQRPLAEDVYEEWRLSKIVPNPRPLEKEEYFTVLTAFIKITQKSEDDDEEYVIPCFKDFERKDGLEKFYCDQGCYYSLEYEEFTPDTVKCLAKMVVGDYTLPVKTSVEIFGEHYKQAMLEDGDHKITMKTKKEKKGKKGKKKAKPSKSDTKQSKEKGSKKGKESKGKESKGSKGKKSKSSKSSKTKVGEEEAIGHEDKEVQVPTIEEVEEEELPEPRAGEPDWEYINLPIPEDVELALGNLWDNFEQNYVQNFKELFYKKRILLGSIVPFLAKTRETLTEVIAREDPKQYYLREFQKTLNQIDLSLRNDPKTKEELYCRIDEFRDKLLGICDTKMTETEEERRNFVRQNWLFRQFCDMVDNLTVAFQLEIDRLVDTLQFLSDYYTAVITKSLKQGYEFHKELLPRCDCNDDSKSETFNNLFINMESENNEETEFHQKIDVNKNIALAFVESMRPLSVKPIAAMKKLFEAKGKGKKEKKPKKGKKGEGKFELDEDVKENADRIFEEWECALNGEFARLDIRLNVIRNKAFHRFGSVIAWIKKIFLIMFDDIKERYENEVASVYKACQLLRESVEKEVIIRPELTFENDQLVEIQVTLFPETLVIPELDDSEGTFKIEQLERIVRILCDLAPNGYIMKKTFMLLIQDILYQDDIEEETDTPKLWRNLTTSTLKALLKKLFDVEVYVYWKDFIVCNLMIPFPTKTELMDIRNQFRQFDPDLTERVTRDNFNSITFSFDDREDVRDRLRSIIFRMYQTDENNLNYTAMLLDFCKDKDPVLGFVKALELSLGKFICNDEEVGKKFVEETLESRMLFEQQLKEHEETTELAKRTISLLIDKIIDQVDGPEGFSLEEVETTPNFRYSGILRATIGSQTKSAHSQLSEGKIVSERKFSYARIGFEAADNTQLCYFLPLYLVQIIVEATVGWNSKVEFLPSPSFKERVVEIYEECRNEQFHNVVLAHQFLNNEKLRELLQSTNKFLAHNPVRIVKHILEDPPEEGEKEEEEEVSGQSFGSGTNLEKQSEL